MRKAIFTAVCLLGLSGCAGMSDTSQRTLTGGAIGAGGGALVGAIAGSPGTGALIGGGLGTLGGFLYGKSEEGRRSAYGAGYGQAQRDMGRGRGYYQQQPYGRMGY